MGAFGWVPRNLPMMISFVIPVFNEEKSLRELYTRISEHISETGHEWEIVFIDDGSNDRSFSIIQSLCEENPRVKGIKFRRNFGKSTALHEGFRIAGGEVVFTMDADLQDDPKEIPRFLVKLDEGYDLVSGWKEQRKDPVLSKNLPSKLFNFMISKFSGLALHDYNCGFKAYRSVLVKRLTLYGDLHRYIPAIAHAMGFRVAEIPVEHHARPYGRSKYGLERFFHGLFDFITIVFLTRFLSRPMHFFGALGLTLFMSGMFICLYLTLLWAAGEPIGGRPLLNLGVLLLILGVQSISIGLIGEMITFGHQSHSSSDVVERILNAS